MLGCYGGHQATPRAGKCLPGFAALHAMTEKLKIDGAATHFIFVPHLKAGIRTLVAAPP